MDERSKPLQNSSGPWRQSHSGSLRTGLDPATVQRLTEALLQPYFSGGPDETLGVGVGVAGVGVGVSSGVDRGVSSGVGLGVAVAAPVFSPDAGEPLAFGNEGGDAGLRTSSDSLEGTDGSCIGGFSRSTKSAFC